MLPGMSGAEVAHLIKQRADIPVIVLSAISAGESKVEMITKYAEDYVTKPFQYAELEARIRRVLRRTGNRRPAADLVLGPDLTLILPGGRALVAGRDVRLSNIESRLLSVLANRLGETVPTSEVLRTVWTRSDEADPRVAWVTVRRLRQKVELDPDNPVYLQTDPHGGYRLVVQADTGD
jgi:DNA-binding response OmpR family regulator